MTAPKTTTLTEGRDLILTRIIDAPREEVFRAHEKMGFHQGWVTCAEQLAALVE